MILSSKPRITRLWQILVLLALACSAAHAQLFSSAQLLQDSTYEYRSLTPATTAANFITQANGEGANRFVFAGNNIFDGATAVSIFGRAAASSATASYQSVPRPSSAANLVTVLNAQGALGFSYLGDNVFGAEFVSLMVKFSGNDVFSYVQLPLAVNQADFLSMINAQGANGFAFAGNVGFDAGGGNFVFSSLFVKNTARSDVFSYETGAISNSGTEFLARAGAQGLRSFRYRGDIIFGGAASALYVKNASRQDRFFYDLATPATSTAGFITQANAQGTRRYLFEGSVGLGSPTVFWAVYVSVRDLVLVSGFE